MACPWPTQWFAHYCIFTAFLSLVHTFKFSNHNWSIWSTHEGNLCPCNQQSSHLSRHRPTDLHSFMASHARTRLGIVSRWRNRWDILTLLSLVALIASLSPATADFSSRSFIQADSRQSLPVADYSLLSHTTHNHLTLHKRSLPGFQTQDKDAHTLQLSFVAFNQSFLLELEPNRCAIVVTQFSLLKRRVDWLTLPLADSFSIRRHRP